MKVSNPRKLVINFILLSGGEALSKIFTFFAFAYLARLLGPDRYGDVEFALAVTLFFTLLVEGGLGLLGSREIAKDEKSVLLLTFHIVVTRIFLAMAAFILLMLFVTICNKSEQERQLVILYGLTLFGVPGLLQWVFQGLDRMHWVAISSVLRWTLFAGIVLLFVKDPEEVWMVPLTELGAIGCVAILNLGAFSYFFGRIWRRFDFAFAISLLRQAAPIALTQLMWGLKLYLPTVMLGLLLGNEQVGWFGSAHRIVIALHTFVWMYFYNLYPSMSRCSQENPDTLQRLAGKSLQVNSWAAVFVGAIGTAFAHPLISFVYGPQYTQAVVGFRFLIWVIAFALISGHYMYILIAYNKQWLELFSAVCGASTTIILTLLLIPKYGFMGAVWAVLFSEAFVWSLNYYFVSRQIAIIRFAPHLIRPLTAGVVMALVLLITSKARFWMMGSAAVVSYILTLLVLQPSIVNDIRTLVMGNRQHS